MAKSTVLAVDQIAENQSSSYLTANGFVTALEKATQKTLSVDFTSGDVTLTQAQFLEQVHFYCENLGAAGALTIPASLTIDATSYTPARLFAVTNTSASHDLDVTDGTATVTMDPETTGLFVYDGTNLVSVSGGSGVTTLLGLSDTPSSYTGESGKVLAVNGGESGLEFITLSSGATTFIALTDTPGSFTGEAGKVLAVNTGETALEFIDAASGGSGGGGLGSWEAIDSGNIASSVSTIEVDITDYEDVMILLDSIAASTTGTLEVQFSDDGGSTWISTSGDYRTTNAGGTESTSDAIQAASASTASAQTALGVVTGLQTGQPFWNGNNNVWWVPSSVGAGAINRIRFRNAFGTMDSGDYYVLGRKQSSGGAGLTVSEQTGTAYTAVLADANTYIQMNNASSNTLTVPANSSVAYAVGTTLTVEMTGAGTTSIAPDTGVTINSRGSLTDIAGQYGVATLIKTATDTWTLTGDLA